MSTLPLRAVGPSTSLLHCIGIYLCNLSQHLVCVHESPRARVLAAVIGSCGRSQHGNMFPIIAHRKGLGPLVLRLSSVGSCIRWCTLKMMLTLTLPESMKAPHYYPAYGVPDWRQAIFFALFFPFFSLSFSGKITGFLSG